jgi:hypothetical protein
VEVTGLNPNTHPTINGPLIRLPEPSGGGAAVPGTTQQETLATRSGAITFEFDNPSTTTEHDFCIEQNGNTLGCTKEIAGAEDRITLALKPGEYMFYCGRPYHREVGMLEQLMVS